MTSVPRFALGQIVTTPGAMQAMEAAGENYTEYLSRHVRGDWGEVCAEDKQANEDALQHGDRLLSAYSVGGVKVWIITEADRSVTTFLLPEDY